MKKTILLFAIFCMTNSIIGQVSIGLSAGNNLCKVNYLVDYESNPYLTEPDDQQLIFTSGFTVGIPIELSVSNKFSMFFNPSYIQKGTKTKNTSTLLGTKSIIEGVVKYNYIEMPIQAKYYIIEKGIRVFVSAGPSLGYLLNGNSKYDISSTNLNDNTTTNESWDSKLESDDIDDAGIKRFDVSLALSIGADYKIGLGKIFFNLNYLHGMINIVDSDIELNKGIEEYNRGIVTTVGYLIPIKSRN